MNTQSTYKTLFAIRHDINTQTQQHASFPVFNRGKIKSFFNENAIRLKMLDDGLKEIYDAHVAKDAKGVYIKSEDGQDWQYKSEEDKEAFMLRFNAFMNTEISISY